MKVRQSTHKTVHPQGGARTRRSVVTAGVLLFRGDAGAGNRQAKRAVYRWQRAEAQFWRSTHKAVHTQGGLWPRHEICYLVCLFSAATRSKGLVVNTHGGAFTRQCTHKEVCGHRMIFVIERGCGRLPPPSKVSRSWSTTSRREGLAVHTQGSAYTRRCTHKAVCDQRRSLVR